MTGDGTPEPGDLADTSLGLTDEEAGHPNPEPPPNDQEIGDAEPIEVLDVDYDQEDDDDA